VSRAIGYRTGIPSLKFEIAVLKKLTLPSHYYRGANSENRRQFSCFDVYIYETSRYCDMSV